jgi:hypothetical protein
MNITFESTAYVGVGPLQFGMDGTEVGKALGQPDYVSKTHEKTTVRGYAGLKLFFSRDDRLVECAFYPPAKLLVGGVDVLGDKLALQKLAKLDARPLRYRQTVLFPSLGLTLGADANADHEAVVFSRGHFDDLLPLFKPYEIVRSV